MMHSDSIDQIAGALARAQGEMKAATKDAANPHLNSKYATLAAVVEAIRDPLAKNGLSVVQPIMETDDGPVLVTMLLHESGQWLSSELKIRVGEGNRGITQVQALGSAITYTRRYALSAMLAIPVDDDDGASADGQAQQRKPQPKQSGKPESKPANGNGNGTPPNSPAQLLDLVNKRVLVPYDSVTHLHNAVRAESTMDDYTWPLQDDTAGWRKAYKMAIDHAKKKTNEPTE